MSPRSCGRLQVVPLLQAIDEPTDPDPPDPSGDRAGAGIGKGFAPYGEKSVLHNLLCKFGVGTAMKQTQEPPRRVPVVQLSKRAPIVVGDRPEEILA
jgi:hypothetical protein